MVLTRSREVKGSTGNSEGGEESELHYNKLEFIGEKGDRWKQRVKQRLVPESKPLLDLSPLFLIKTSSPF